MDKVDTTLRIECLIECPLCGVLIDLFEFESLTDDGYIYKELMSDDGPWGHENWGEIIQCPDCKEKITIGDVVW